jgi:photosystem II stability/assembly factor-like uncharacterized protein
MQFPVRMLKRPRRRAAFRLLLVILATAPVTIYGGVNVWTGLGPEGGLVGPPAVDPRNPGTLYVSAAGKIFKTTDAAAHWRGISPVVNRSGGAFLSILAVDPWNSSTIYGEATGFGCDLFKSTDGGATWSEASSGLSGISCATPPGLAIDPKNSSTLYVTTGTGLFKSTNGAASWSAAGAGLPDHTPDGRAFFSLNALVIDPHNASTLYAATTLTLGYGGVVFKSTDGAASWSAINSGLTRMGLQITFLAIDPKHPGTVYAVSAATLFKTTDGGSNWTVANSGFTSRSVAIDSQDVNVLYAPIDLGISKSVDGGETWSTVLSGLTGETWVVVAPGERHPRPGHAQARSVQGQSTVYAGASGLGILKSTDGGATWATANSGLGAAAITALAVDPRNPDAVFAGVFEAGIFASRDGGGSWSANPVLPATNVYALQIDPQHPGTVYATTNAGFRNDAGAFKSTDEGRNWVTLDVPGVLAIDPQEPGTLYGLGGFKSTDGGASWSKMALPQSAWITALAVDPQDRNRLYAAGAVDGPCSINTVTLQSVDAGMNWSLRTFACDSFFIDRLVADPRNPGTVYATIQCTDGPCPVDPGYRTTDGGTTWAKWNLPGGSRILAINPQGTIYAQTSYSDTTGLVSSTDGGVTWSPVAATGLTLPISVLAFDPRNQNHLYGGSAGGVFEITLGQLL